MENNVRPETMARINTKALADQFIAEQVKEILKNEMEKAVALSVPLTVDANIGKTWFDTK